MPKRSRSEATGPAPAPESHTNAAHTNAAAAFFEAVIKAADPTAGVEDAIAFFAITGPAIAAAAKEAFFAKANPNPEAAAKEAKACPDIIGYWLLADAIAVAFAGAGEEEAAQAFRCAIDVMDQTLSPELKDVAKAKVAAAQSARLARLAKLDHKEKKLLAARALALTKKIFMSIKNMAS